MGGCTLHILYMPSLWQDAPSKLARVDMGSVNWPQAPSSCWWTVKAQAAPASSAANPTLMLSAGELAAAVLAHFTLGMTCRDTTQGFLLEEGCPQAVSQMLFSDCYQVADLSCAAKVPSAGTCCPAHQGDLRHQISDTKSVPAEQSTGQARPQRGAPAKAPYSRQVPGARPKAALQRRHSAAATIAAPAAAAHPTHHRCRRSCRLRRLRRHGASCSPRRRRRRQ